MIICSNQSTINVNSLSCVFERCRASFVALLTVFHMVLTFHVPIRTEFFAFKKGWRWVQTVTFLIFQAFSCARHWVSSASLNTRFLVLCFGFCNKHIFYLVGPLVLRKTPDTGGPLCWFSSAYSSSTSNYPAWWDLSGTSLGFPVGRKPSHHRQGISTRKGLINSN